MADKRGDITANMLGPERVIVTGDQSIPDYAAPTFKSIDSLREFLEANGYVRAKTKDMTKNDLIFAARKLISQIAPLVIE